MFDAVKKSILKNSTRKLKNNALHALIQSINMNVSVNNLVQSSPVCHKVFDPDFNLWFMSQAGVTALKIKSIEEYYGHVFPTESAPQETRDIFRQTMQLAAQGETNTIEYCFDVQGETIWFRTAISPFFDGKGNLLYITADSMSITDRVEAQESLALAKEEAERANRAKSEFLSRTSHELRTPLNAILGFGQLMKAKTDMDSDERNDGLDNILLAGGHLLQLVNEILDLSVVESGKFHIKQQSLNASQVTDNLIAQIQHLAKKKDIRVWNKLAQKDDIYISADSRAFSQIMLNLLNNAVKYNIENGLIIVDAGSSGGNHWISVSDDGPGVAKENVESLFEPFNRLGQEYGDIEGTGIGLSLCRDLAELLGGSISVESELGKGCTFKLVLQKGDKALEEVSSSKLGVNTVSASTKSDSSKILYIEDNLQNLELVTKIFETQENIDFNSATCPQDGIGFARTHAPDLILMDMQLPEMDGLGVFSELQKHQETRDIPVVAVSGLAMKEDIEKAMEAGFSGYITKPLEITSFLKQVSGFV